MKFRGHETFSIRKNWLSKGMRHVVERPDVFTSKEINPMDALGIGANMVKALRYWLPVVGLTIEERAKQGKFIQRLTKFGKLVNRYDPYTEEMGTLWLLHYHLAKNVDGATSWFYFFNRFHLSEFTKEDFTSSLMNCLRLKGEEVAQRTIDDDFSCIINTYLPRYKSLSGRDDPENNMDCPLTELSILDYQSKSERIYKKIAPIRRSIDPLILLAVILDNSNGRKELSLEEIRRSDCNIGLVFNLDLISLMEMLTLVENEGLAQIVHTSGLDVLRINTELSFLDCVEKYYREL